MLHHIVQSNDSTFWSSLYNTWLEKKIKTTTIKGWIHWPKEIQQLLKFCIYRCSLLFFGAEWTTASLLTSKILVYVHIQMSDFGHCKLHSFGYKENPFMWSFCVDQGNLYNLLSLQACITCLFGNRNMFVHIMKVNASKTILDPIDFHWPLPLYGHFSVFFFSKQYFSIVPKKKQNGI